jgi:serine/threonine protein kinase
LKIQYKREIIDYGQAQGVIREKNILARMRHPFVMNIVNADQDMARLYMVMNLLQGGELRSVMCASKKGHLDEESARFYEAGILDGLSYLHRRLFVYRDLKVCSQSMVMFLKYDVA